jgi:hypothetical protein
MFMIMVKKKFKALKSAFSVSLFYSMLNLDLRFDADCYSNYSQS